MMHSDLEVIAEYGNHPEAELAAQLLDSNGIQSYTHSDDCGGVAGGQTFIRGVRLLVHRVDLKRAKEILNIS
jgi:hypothetical protein